MLEVYGPGVTPSMIEKIEKIEDIASAYIVETIMHNEVGHVAMGKIWFDYICGCERMHQVSSCNRW